MNNIAIFGVSGAIGSALVQTLTLHYPKARIHAFSRNLGSYDAQNVIYNDIDYFDEAALAAAADQASHTMPLDLVIVATGVLHNDAIKPEKSLKDLSETQLSDVFRVNTILPALIAKHFIPKLANKQPSIFAALSARVGSISDNRLGGWYGYRASKTALNMIIKTASLETARRNKYAIIVGLHPGTVDSQLSQPFQSNVAKDSLFSPESSAKKLLHVLQQLSPDDSGRCIAWDGQVIQP